MSVITLLRSLLLLGVSVNWAVLGHFGGFKGQDDHFAAHTLFEYALLCAPQEMGGRASASYG